MSAGAGMDLGYGIGWGLCHESLPWSGDAISGDVTGSFTCKQQLGAFGGAVAGVGGLAADEGLDGGVVADGGPEEFEGVEGVGDADVAAFRRFVSGGFDGEYFGQDAREEVRLGQGDAGGVEDGVGGGDHVVLLDRGEKAVEELVEFVFGIHGGEKGENAGGVPTDDVGGTVEQGD